MGIVERCEVCSYTGEGLVSHHIVPNPVRRKEAEETRRKHFTSEEVTSGRKLPWIIPQVFAVERISTLCAICHAKIHAFCRRKRCRTSSDFFAAFEEFKELKGNWRELMEISKVLPTMTKSEKRALIEQLLQDPELREELVDIALFYQRKKEPSRPYQEFVEELRREGKL